MARLFTIISSFAVLLLLSDVGMAVETAPIALGDLGTAVETAPKAAVGDANVKRFCAETPYPDVCADMIARYDDECKGADDKKLAGMAALTTATLLLKASADASPGVQKQRYPDLTKADEECFETCYKELTNGGEKLDNLCTSKEGSDDIGMAQLPEIRSFIKENNGAHAQWNCDRCRPANDKKTPDDVSKKNDAEKAMAVLDVLVNKVTK
ncbi:hypothetical protein CFC21_094842 [Triticum aestivum]|uniref:Pectinesterase inhibitor domain-containing protein n=3 Tax=Triticinae TaxID=1648030 RepID=A0A3B6QLG1_WHEAT|nr:uncharacterized protein LOC109787261 [Aegilops tauschii subsp. strangulata]XP_044417185.1 uncharacterized protein LOC123142262 [Triticum aestivum]KAF7092351.1 hypothetical protein CFC21_094842 [Triticum aestivum]